LYQSSLPSPFFSLDSP
jgi:hypothetical protein